MKECPILEFQRFHKENKQSKNLQLVATVLCTVQLSATTLWHGRATWLIVTWLPWLHGLVLEAPCWKGKQEEINTLVIS